MKILLIHPHLFAGGAERQLLYLTRYLTKKHDVAVCTLSVEENLPDFFNDLNLIVPKNVTRFSFIDRRLERYLYSAKTILHLRNLVKSIEKEYELLNPHNFPAPLACSRNKDRNVVWMCNESPGFFGNELEQRLNPVSSFWNELFLKLEKVLTKRYVDEICTVSKLAAGKLNQRYKKPTQVKYPGVDYEFYCNGSPRAAIEKYNLFDSFVVLQVGQVTFQKNQMESILALENLIDLIPNIKLVIAGRGDNAYSLQLRHYIAAKGLEGYIIFTGSITDEEVRDLYHACNVNVFPTRLQSFGLSPLEGLCAAKIPVVSPLCGVSDLIKEHDIGVVSDNIVDSISKIYHSPEQFQAKASYGCTIVKHSLTWNNYCAGMEEVFLKYEKK